MYSEYRILSALFLTSAYESKCPLLFHTYEILQEFKLLMKGSIQCDWNWRTGNVSTAVDNLRNLNSKIVDIFFWKVWDVKKDPLGPLIFKLLDCSIPSKYNLTLTHELEPKFKDFKCHLSGSYEILDQSNTLSSPPVGIQDADSDKSTRVLASYICATIRWGNLFHTLRLRWVCMDRALALGRRQPPGWPLIDAGFPSLQNSQRSIVSQDVTELRNGEKKIRKVFKKDGDEMTEPPSWLGLKCAMQLWCPVTSEPLGLIDYDLIKMDSKSELPKEDITCKMPYLFKMEFKAYVRAMKHRSQGVVESMVWVEETPDSISITQSKHLVQSPQ